MGTSLTRLDDDEILILSSQARLDGNAAARLRHIAAGKWFARKYMNMTPLYQEQNHVPGSVVSM